MGTNCIHKAGLLVLWLFIVLEWWKGREEHEASLGHFSTLLIYETPKSSGFGSLGSGEGWEAVGARLPTQVPLEAQFLLLGCLMINALGLPTSY